MNVSITKPLASLPLVAVLSLLGSAAAAVAATTTYDGSNTPYTGGMIDPGDTVLLNDGAAVTGDVIDNGTLQWNQTGALTISSTISGTGTLSLTNTGTLNLNGADVSGEHRRSGHDHQCVGRVASDPVRQRVSQDR